MKIIFKSLDWADEFSYPVVSICNEEDLAEAIAMTNALPEPVIDPKYSWKKTGAIEFGFGTNEAFTWYKQDILDILKSAKDFPEEDKQIFDKYVPKYLGMDIVEQILEWDA